MYYLRFFLCFISNGLMGLIGLKSSWSWLVIQNVLFKLSNLKLPTEPLRFMVKWFLTNKTDYLPIVCRQFLKVPLSNPVEQKQMNFVKKDEKSDVSIFIANFCCCFFHYFLWSFWKHSLHWTDSFSTFFMRFLYIWLFSTGF